MLSAILGISSARSALRHQAEPIIFTMLHERRAFRLADMERSFGHVRLGSFSTEAASFPAAHFRLTPKSRRQVPMRNWSHGPLSDIAYSNRIQLRHRPASAT